MVKTTSSSQSRAGSLALVGGELAFDFANTASARGSPSRQDHLRSAENVVEWARHARALGPADGEWLRLAAAADPVLAAGMLARALDLRENVYAAGAAIAAGAPAPDTAVEAIARTHAACLACARLAPFEGRYVWSWSPSESAIESVLGPIALSALATLTQGDLSRVKQCQGDRCGWLFFDTSKNRSRRWCEMEVCGNRAKQRRHSAGIRRA
ncbi:MAG: CGNR zinc finger domain-containing protein [Roseiarcus sp.]